MDSTSSSLRALIDKWFSPATLLRVRRFTMSPRGVPRCVRVESMGNGAERVIFFFQHGDGVWRVYPPDPRLNRSSRYYAGV
ncbi:hypothetical protein [Paraburkholderia oxyphila]|uniref:hypothetical protein n=1 Tax=Paraburkholderia oxyphila TaxID=614212 RepID=UPI0009FC5CE3|nr:hypothetical protein [Paraburkholderia oxyphila]